MVWEAIGYGWKSKLIFLRPSGKRGITAKDYEQQVLEAYLGPIMANTRERDPDTFIVEDNAPVHSRKSTQATQVRYQINSIDWPASSPDFNPIENVWRVIKQRLRNRDCDGPWTLPELEKAVQEEWDALQPHEWNKYIDQMRERLQQGADRKGYQTVYEKLYEYTSIIVVELAYVGWPSLLRNASYERGSAELSGHPKRTGAKVSLTFSISQFYLNMR